MAKPLPTLCRTSGAVMDRWCSLKASVALTRRAQQGTTQLYHGILSKRQASQPWKGAETVNAPGSSHERASVCGEQQRVTRELLLRPGCVRIGSVRSANVVRDDG